MKNLTIRSKIIAAFACVLLVLAGLGVFAVDRMSSLNAVTVEITENWLPSVAVLGELDALLATRRAAEARHIMSTEPGDIATADARLAELDKAIVDDFAVYEPLIASPEERQLYDAFRPAWDGYIKSGTKMVDLSRANQNAEATKLFFGESFQQFGDVQQKLDALGDFNDRGAEAAHVASADTYASSRTIVFGIIGAGLLITIAIAWGIVRGVSVPVQRMTGVMAKLAAGDKTVAIVGADRKDEIGAMAKAVQVFKDNALEVDRLKAEQEASTKRAAEQSKAAMAKLASEFESSVGGIVNMVSSAAAEMETTASSMTATAEETSRQSTAVAAASEQASTNVQTVASASEELSSSIAEITRQVAQSSSISGKAVVDAERTNTLVNSLVEAAQKIGAVTSLINDIASQTNLLALNATIEAARAGEAGKGFAVVASEVKSLANQTAKATEEIGAQIAAMQSATGETVSAIGSIGATIAQINEIATAIAAAVEEQGAATQEIARNVQQAAAGTQEVSSNIAGVTRAASETGASATEVLGAAGELSRQAEQLRGQVDRFLVAVRAA